MESKRIIALVAMMMLLGVAMSNPILNEMMPAEQLRATMFTEQISGKLESLIPMDQQHHYYGKKIDSYEITMSQTQQQLLPAGFPTTKMYTYGGMTKNGYQSSFPSPSISATYRTPVQVKWINNIAGPHFLPQDFSFPFSNDLVFVNEVPVVPHLHGIATESGSDGQPMAFWSKSGVRGQRYASVRPTDINAAIYRYPNEQKGALLWFHDHTMSITRLNVYAGLVGFYQINNPGSPEEAQIEKTYGKLEERSLILTDKSFKRSGDLYYPETTEIVDFTAWNPEFFGNTWVVNGKVWPKMVLNEGQKYRILLLNGCQSRFVNFFLTNDGNRLPFELIRADSDYYMNPVTVSEYNLPISSRIVIVVDTTGITGDILIKNDAPGPFPSGDPENLVDEFTGTILKIEVTPQPEKVVSNIYSYSKYLSFYKSYVLPTSSFNIPKAYYTRGSYKNIYINSYIQMKPKVFPNFPEGEKVFVTLTEASNDLDQPIGAKIDDISFETSQACVNSTYNIGQIYDFYMINLTPDGHPLHFHLINFQKVATYHFNSDAYITAYHAANGGPPPVAGYPTIPIRLDPTPFFIDGPIAPEPHEQTFRDVSNILPGEVVVFRMKFAHNDGSNFGFNVAGGSFVFHCHILEHQDNDMMKYYCLDNAPTKY